MDFIPDYRLDAQQIAKVMPNGVKGFKAIAEAATAAKATAGLEARHMHAELKYFCEHFIAPEGVFKHQEGKAVRELLKSITKGSPGYVAPVLAWICKDHPAHAKRLYRTLGLRYRPFRKPGWQTTSLRHDINVDPESWLSPYNTRSIPFQGRQDEFAVLNEFLAADLDFLIIAISGASGSGKTRLFVEWVHQHVSEEDWFVCRFDASEIDMWRTWVPDAPTIILVDQLAGFSEFVQLIVSKCSHQHDAEIDFKVRLVVVDRIFPADIRKIADLSVWNVHLQAAPAVARTTSNFYATPLINLNDRRLSKREYYGVLEGLIRRQAVNMSDLTATVNALHELRDTSTPLIAALAGTALAKGDRAIATERREIIQNFLSGADRMIWKDDTPLSLSAANLAAAANTLGEISAPQVIKKDQNLKKFGIQEQTQLIETAQRLLGRNADPNLLVRIQPSIVAESQFLLQMRDYQHNEDAQRTVFETINAGLGQGKRNPVIPPPVFWKAMLENISVAQEDSLDGELIAALREVFDFDSPMLPKNLALYWASAAINAFESYAEANGEIAIEHLDIYHCLQKVFANHKSKLKTLDVFEPPFAGILQTVEWLIRNTSEMPAIVKDIAIYLRTHWRSEFCGLHSAAAFGCAALCEWLVGLGVPVDTVSKDTKCTALIFAALNGEVETVHILLQLGADVNFSSPHHGGTALMAACQGGHSDTVRIILERGADPRAITMDGSMHAAMLACGADSVECLRTLCNEDPTILSLRTKPESHLLGMASTWDAAETVEYLLKLPRTVTGITNREVLEAALLAKLHGHADVIQRLKVFSGVCLPPIVLQRPHEALLDLGVGARDRVAFGKAISNHIEQMRAEILETAETAEKSGSGHIEPTDFFSDFNEDDIRLYMCMMRLGGGAKAQDENTGNTFLGGLVGQEHQALLQLALDFGFDPNVASKPGGYTPLMIACSEGNLEGVKLLIEHGADPRHLNAHGLSALHYAVGEANAPIIRELISAGADWSFDPDHETQSVMRTALASESVSALKALLQCGYPINDPISENGTLAIHLAVNGGNLERIEVLLSAGANVDGIIANKFTPLRIALENSRLDIGELLIANDADPYFEFPKGHSYLHLAAAFWNEEVLQWVLRFFPNVDGPRDENGATALMGACKRGNLACLDPLFEAGAGVNAATKPAAETPLFYAVYGGSLEAVNWLIRHNADVNVVRSTDGLTPLMHAIAEGQTQIVKLLLSVGADPNLTEHRENVTPLIAASLAGHTDIARMLLDSGAKDGDTTSDIGSTALTIAAQEGYVDLVALLCSRGSDVDCQRGGNGPTALMLAAIEGHNDAAKTLLAHRANPNLCLQNDLGQTALMFASAEGHLELVKLLVEHGAYLNIQSTDSSMRSALFCAIESGHFGIARYLLEEGANPNLGRTEKGFTAIMIMAAAGQVELVRMSLAQGVNIVDQNNDESQTPLMAACYVGSLVVVEQLLDAGADPNQNCEDDNASPLMFASQAGHLDIVRLLIKRGAIPDATTFDGQNSAYTFAIRNGHDEVAKFLADLTNHT